MKKRKLPWRPFLLLVVGILVGVCGFLYGWGISIAGGLFLAFVMIKLDEMIGAFSAGTLAMELGRDRLAMGETLRGVVTFRAKRAQTVSRIGVTLDLVTRVTMRGMEGPERVNVVLAGVNCDLSDSAGDIGAGQTLRIPFDFEAPTHWRTQDAKTGFWSKFTASDLDEIKAMDAEELRKAHRLYWVVSSSLLADDIVCSAKEKKLKLA